MTCISRINISRSYTEGREFESHLELHASHSLHVFDLFIYFPVLYLFFNLFFVYSQRDCVSD